MWADVMWKCGFAFVISCPVAGRNSVVMNGGRFEPAFVDIEERV
jgi:hypothetical protein